MRNIHRELTAAPESYVFNTGCPPAMYKSLTALTLSRLEQILDGSEDFVSEEAWLIRRDIVSLMETLTATTGAHHSQVFFGGGVGNGSDKQKVG